MEGWIRLHRKLLESGIFQNEKLLKVWIWCLLKATHKEHTQLVGMQRIKLEKGQFIFGRKKAAEELKMSENMVYRYMMFLKDEGNIDIKANNKYSVVTIEKWGEYQTQEKQIDNKKNNKQTTNRQQIDTNNNVNNDNKYINLFINNKESDFVPYEEGDEISKWLKTKGINSVKEYKELDSFKQDELMEEWFSK